jgi:hypothetical protein
MKPKLILTIALFVLLPSISSPAPAAQLVLTQSGTGIEHKVTVESIGLFRLVFEADHNYGISKVYDLVNDPTAATDLTQNQGPRMSELQEQAALFNQRITRDDLIGHTLAAKTYFSNTPRRITIIENTSARVVIENTYSPMFGGVNTNIIFTDTYYIYPNGKLYIHHKLHSVTEQEIGEWRNSILTFGDPFYMLDAVDIISAVADNNARTMTDSSKNWTSNQWAGYEIDYGYNGWSITGNTSNTLQIGAKLWGSGPDILTNDTYTIHTRSDKYGWIRASNNQNPYHWVDQNQNPITYIFQYWDHDTPAPYTNWTKASYLLVRKPNNPYQGGAGLHEWNGMKRWYWNYNPSPPFIAAAGQDIVQEYMIQIGAENSSILPDIRSSMVADPIAAAYISSPDPPGGMVDPASDSQAPTTPADLTLVARTSSQISLSWKAATDNIAVAGYRVYRNATLITTQYVTSFADTNLQPQTTYSYTISAFDSAGNTSHLSLPLSAATLAYIAPIAAASRSYAILDYNSASPSKELMDWINTHFSWKLGGGTLRRPDSSVHWPMYYDPFGPASPESLIRLKDWAANNGVLYEEMLLHAKANYTAIIDTGDASWNGMDKFDIFENANGVLRTSDNIIFADFTNTAYSGSTIWQDILYIGYEEAFDQINLVFSTFGSNITAVWEYWDGSSWSRLPVVDQTQYFTTSGSISFIPPSDWTRKIINQSRSKYFVRCRITAAGRYPVTSSIRGDNWLRSGPQLCRGWDPLSSSIVNSGELKYNPTPPQSASAKFPYQARLSYWGQNHYVLNPADFQLIARIGTRTSAAFVAFDIIDLAVQSGRSAVMLDDMSRNPSSIIANYTSGITDFSDKASDSWPTVSFDAFMDLKARLKSSLPTFLLGVNTQLRTIASISDWNVAEYHSFNWNSASPRGIALQDDTTSMTYDDYLPVNNKYGSVGILIYQDTEDVVPGRTASWDRANRGPMAAISKHLIAANDHTIFSYYTQGGFIYSNTDEVFLKDLSVIHQATDTIPDITSVHHWATYFPAMSVDFGVPDPAGWNGGIRSFAWKLHSDIGGAQDIWRRDYTKAIILHRPAQWNTTDVEYNTACSAISLGNTYYPLYANGTTGSAITSISLRAGEGAVLLKAPLSSHQTSTPQAPKGLRISTP